MHGIIEIVGATLAVALNPAVAQDAAVAQNPAVALNRAGASPAPTIAIAMAMAMVGDIVGAYKSLVHKCCLDICKSKNNVLGKLWQRNYYEHIIRNEQSYLRISEYILHNPQNWKSDKFYTEE